MTAFYLILCLMVTATTHAAYFSQQPQDQVVISGQPVTLPCVIVGYRGMVQWTKDGLALGGERDLPGWTRYSLMGDPVSGEHSLLIDSAELADDAVYECQATQAGLRSHRAKLTVLVPPSDPVVEGGPVVRLKAHTPHNLTCKASGAKPAAEITWYRDGEVMETAIYSKTPMEDGKRENAVSLLPIIPEDSDTGRTYTCRVLNPAAPAGQQTSVTINVQHPPAVTLSVQPQTVTEGAKVLFICSASANPEITGYRWSKGGVPISEANGDSLEVTVDYSYFTDPISCEVSNSVGSTNVSTLVDVQFGPRLLSEPKPMTVDTGMDAAFTCAWTGNPPLTLAWTKQGSIVVLSNSNTLQLKAVTQEDAGTYTCKAIVPRIGVAERDVTLTVNGPPIITADATQHAVKHSKGKLECRVGSSPPPDKIVWTFGDIALSSGSSGRYSVQTVTSDHGVVSSLVLSETLAQDFQLRYNCTAWNRFGTGTALVTLREQEALPMLIIVGGAVGGGCVLLICVITLVSLCCRHTGKGELNGQYGQEGQQPILLRTFPFKSFPFVKGALGSPKATSGYKLCTAITTRHVATMTRRMSKSRWLPTAVSLQGHRAQNTATSWKRRRMRDQTSRIPLMVTIRSVATKTATSAAADSPNTCPIPDQSTLHPSCPPPAPCTASTAPNPVYTTSPRDTRPLQRAEPRTNSSKLPSSNSSPPSPPAFTPLTLFTAAPLTYPPPTAAPSPATSSPPPTRRWTRTISRIRPARCPAHPASLTPPHKCPPSSPTTAGLHSACRHTSDRTVRDERRSSEWLTILTRAGLI